jgi:acylphosphatase
MRGKEKYEDDGNKGRRGSARVGRRITVYGEVQHVGYRRRVVGIARRIGIDGSAKNKRDGSVEILVYAHNEQINEFLDEIRMSEPPVNVVKVEVKDIPLAKAKGFRITAGTFVEELQEGLGAGESQLYLFRNEFKDYRNEFKDYRNEFRGFASRTDQNFGELKDSLNSFASRTDQNFGILNSKYGEISEKLTVILETLQKQSDEGRRRFEELQRESIESREALKRSLDTLVELVKSITSKG